MTPLPFRLVLPCYNEAPSLPGLVERALACARKRGLGPERFTLILVENGSSDDSAAVLQELKRKPGGEFIQIVPVKPNRGYGNGVYQGLCAAARPAILGWSHADEQCDPEDAFRAWEYLAADGAPRALVKGQRLGRELGARLFSRGFELTTLAILGERLHEINAQPKVFHSALLDRLTDPPPDFSFDLFVLLRARESGLAIHEIDVRFPPRAHGESRWAATFRSKARTIRGIVRYMVRYRAAGKGGAG